MCVCLCVCACACVRACVNERQDKGTVRMQEEVAKVNDCKPGAKMYKVVESAEEK